MWIIYPLVNKKFFDKKKKKKGRNFLAMNDYIQNFIYHYIIYHIICKPNTVLYVQFSVDLIFFSLFCINKKKKYLEY